MAVPTLLWVRDHTAAVSDNREGHSRVVAILETAERIGFFELRNEYRFTRTKRWIRLDAQVLNELVRDGWSSTPKEQAELLRKALEYDELAVVKGLIDVGSDPNGTYFGTNTPPLMMVQSAAAARLLLNAGANPGARNDNGGRR